MRNNVTTIMLLVNCAAALVCRADQTGIASPCVPAADVLTLTGDVEIAVPAGTTNHIEFLLGGNHTITKTGAGCLEIGIVTNTGVSIAVSGGTLAFSDPRTLTTTGTLFHVDASLASSLVTVTENGTNFVTRWNDAEGGAYYATYDTARPRPMLAVNHAAGLDMIDFGQLYYSSDKGAAHADATRDPLDAATQAILKSGYGAAFNISAQISGVKDYVYVMQDREESKDLVAVTTSYEIPGPSVLGPSANYGGRGGGCNGTSPFLIYRRMHGNATSDYFLDGSWSGINPLQTRPAAEQIHVLYHTKDFELPFSTLGRCESYGGMRIGEVIMFNRLLAADERRLLIAALCSKWRGMSFASLTLAQGTSLHVNGHKLTVGAFTDGGATEISGDGQLAVTKYTDLAPFPVAGNSVTPGPLAYYPVHPGYAFMADGAVNVTNGMLRFEYLSAAGMFTKTGSGALKVAAVGTGVTGIAVEGGSLVVSAREGQSPVSRFDMSDESHMTVEENEDGTNYVTQILDLVGGTTSATVLNENIVVGTSRPIPKPFLARNIRNGHTMLDFGTMASTANTNGYGAAMKLSSGKTRLGEIYCVFEDNEEAKTYPIPEVSYAATGYLGPSPLSVAGNPQGDLYLMRGQGGNGNGFWLLYGNVHSIHMSGSQCRVNNVDHNVKTLIPNELNVVQYRTKDNACVLSVGYMGLSMLGTGIPARYVRGGCRIGEVAMFTYEPQDEVRRAAARELLHKWKGTANPVTYDSLSVAAGTSFRQDEADVTVGSLSGAGTVDMSVTLGANGVLETTLANDFSDNALACTGTLTLPANGTLRVDADWGHLAAFGGKREVKVVNCANISGSVDGWKVVSANHDRPVRGTVELKADGLYAKLADSRGVTVIFR